MFFYAGHRSNTIDRRSGNRCWDSELGSLINDDDWVGYTTMIDMMGWTLTVTSAAWIAWSLAIAESVETNGVGSPCARYHCRCRSRWLPRVWNRSIGGERWMLWLLKFLKKSLHIVEYWVVGVWDRWKTWERCFRLYNHAPTQPVTVNFN